jgi:prevent-host-death family protein
MRTATVRQVRHDFGTVLKLVEDGEEIAITKRGHVVARLCPPPRSRPHKATMPDFAARLKRTFGNKVLPATGADLVAADRGRD